MISTLYNGLDKDHHLEKSANGLTAVRNKKGCCYSKVLADQVEKERHAINSAVGSLTSSLSAYKNGDDIAILYASIRKRYKSIHAQTSGFIAWLKSLFRTCKHNRELKLLKQEYLKLQQAIPKKLLMESISNKALAKTPTQTEQELCKQLKKELPDLFRKGKVSAKDFDQAPFFIEQKKVGYSIAFLPHQSTQPVIKSLDSLSQLKTLVLEQHAHHLLQDVNRAVSGYKGLLDPTKPLGTSIKTDKDAVSLKIDYFDHALGNYASRNIPIQEETSAEVFKSIAEECLFKGAFLPQPNSLTALSNFCQTNGERILDLNLENLTDLTEADLYALCAKCKNLKTLKVRSDHITALDLSSQKNITHVDLECSRLHTLNLAQLTALTELHLSKLSILKNLNASGCANLLLPDLSPCSELEELYLRACRFDRLPFQRLSNLKTLDLCEAPILKELEIADCPKLERLFAARCAALETASLKNLPFLQEITFAESRQLATVLLDGLENFVKVRGSDTFYVKLIEAASCTRLEIKNMPAQCISFDCNQKKSLRLYIHDIPTLATISFQQRSIETIQLDNVKNVAFMIFDRTTFTPEGFYSLCQQIPQLNNLEELNFSMSNLDDAMFEDLAQHLNTLPNFSRITVSGTAITKVPATLKPTIQVVQ